MILGKKRVGSKSLPCLLGVLLCLLSISGQPVPRNKLIYILLDGFRYDYVAAQSSDALPGFSRFLREGVQAKYMTPIYPSISYPDWTTLVTGLWAESHGIVGNYIYDDGDEFSLYNAQETGQAKWWTAEPIWTTATKANLKTGVILWSRCDVPFDGIVPHYCEHFEKKEGPEIFKINIDKALKMLEQDYDFIQVYNEHADGVGHKYGPDSEELKQAVRDLDKTIYYLLDQLDAMGMRNQVNIIIVSDHGMASTGPDAVQRVELDDYLLTDLVENVADSGAFSNIKVKEGYTDQVYQHLKSIPGVEVYRHKDIPDSLHFKNNEYIHEIILKADINTLIMPSRSPVQLPPRDDSYTMMGAHGYDPHEKTMGAIFFASGPDFKSGTAVIPPIKNVDVYPLLGRLLNVNPRPNNGTLDTISLSLQD